MKKLILITTFLISLLTPIFGKDIAFFLGEGRTYRKDVPTPESVFGFQIGEWHVRHDLLFQYMTVLAEASDRVVLEKIGYTHEHRPLVNLVISSPENIARLEEIKKRHRDAALNGLNGDISSEMPVVIWLGYSVHGNEPSGSNASPLVAYYLAAAEGIDDLLRETVILLDPSLNPDGMSRFAQWANMHRGKNLVSDPQNREHNEAWPSGRTNHYWFDLNRDWLLLQHPESRARISRFHEWRPTIVTDFHEMGTNSTYFFQPGIPSRQNPLTPDKNFDLTSLIAKYHAKALDQNGVLYFSEQVFDDFYYGKGSTYPDIQGSIGILFEQSSARGHVQERAQGEISLAEAVRNHVSTSLSTLKAGLENRAGLLYYQYGFFQQALSQAEKDKVKAYVIDTGKDPGRGHELLSILTRHQIECYRLSRPISRGDTTIENGWIVPTNQRQYLLVKSLFEPNTTFKDQTFYDISTWHFPSAFWADYLSLDAKSFSTGLLGEKIATPTLPAQSVESVETRPYAYAFEWHGYYAPRAAYALLREGVQLRFSTQTFTARTGSGDRLFDYGTVIVPMGLQTIDPSAIASKLETVAQRDGVKIHAIETGLTSGGVDLGSPSILPIEEPKTMILIGSGISAYDVGEVWHLLDNRFDMETSLVETDRIGRIDLDRYTHLIMVSGSFRFDKDETEKIKRWVRKGGTLIASKNAIRWVGDSELIPFTVKKDDQKKEEETKKFLPYGERAEINALRLISGAIFQGVADLTHPLCFGIEKNEIALFKRGTLFVEPSDNPYATVVHYSQTPLISGYVSEENLEKIKGSAAVIAEGVGDGSVILMVDAPNFRGFWYGPNKLLLNALFFSPAIDQTRQNR